MKSATYILFTLLMFVSLSPCYATIAVEDSLNIPEVQAAAERGDPEAQFQLGTAYQMGEGVQQNDLQAVHWITKAANQGYPDAQFNLGMAYRGGYGVPQDLVQAYMWLELAVANGSSKAFDLRRDLSLSMSIDQIEDAQYRAKHWKPPVEEE